MARSEGLLGLSVRWARDVVRVHRVRGAARLWNRNNPDDAIREGDEVLAVNGQRGPEQMRAAWTQGSTVYVTLRARRLREEERLPEESGARWRAIVERTREECWRSFRGGQDSDAAYFCDTHFDDRLLNTAKFEHSDSEAAREGLREQEFRVRRLRDQPRKYNNFTYVGFKVMDIPVELYSILRNFHKSERLRKAQAENMPWADPHIAGRDVATWLVPLPSRLRATVARHLSQIIADWAQVDIMDLSLEAVYGVRLYHQRAHLHRHVDVEDTHVLSAILEVGRADDRDVAPWPLSIIDHNGTEHLLPDRSGQMILYESATCPHGRLGDFPGREKANVFVHFKPKGWPTAFLRPAELVDDDSEWEDWSDDEL